ncbi:MAG: hypothetical protein AAGH72_12275 [Verrucomicrobiota bacterium]
MSKLRDKSVQFFCGYVFLYSLAITMYIYVEYEKVYVSFGLLAIFAFFLSYVQNKIAFFFAKSVVIVFSIINGISFLFYVYFFLNELTHRGRFFGMSLDDLSPYFYLSLTFFNAILPFVIGRIFIVGAEEK